MRRITRHHFFKVVNRVSVALLVSGDASELITGVDLFRIDLECTLKACARFVQFTTTLMNESKVVMRGSICRIQGGRLEILLERRLRSMTANNVAEVTAQQ